MQIHRGLSAFLVGLALAALGGCTAAGPIVTCGDGTTLSNGQCLPSSIVRCGDGTTLSAEGTCQPNSTLTCGEGTVAKDGACVPASVITCGPGTVLTGTACTPEDLMKRVTVPEASEPNFPATNATFTIPEIGAPAVVLGGFVNKTADGEADLDGFTFTAKRLTRIRIAAKAFGSPTAAFLLQPCKAGVTPCELDGVANFGRFALSTESRDSGRNIVIPYDGTYVLLFSDSSNLSGGLTMGGDSFSYFAEVTQVAQPAPVPLSVGTAYSGDGSLLVGNSIDAEGDDRLYDFTLAPDSPTAPLLGQRALWATGADGKMLFSVNDESDIFGTTPIDTQRVVLPVGTSQVFFDYVFRLGDGPIPYVLTAAKVATTAKTLVPGTPDVQAATLAGDGEELIVVDVAPNSVLTATMSQVGSDIRPRIEFRNDKYEEVEAVHGPSMTRFFGVAEAGRYYVVIKDREFKPTDTALTYTLELSTNPALPVGPVSVGADQSLTAQALDTAGQAFFAVYAGNSGIATVTATPTAAEVDLTAGGLLNDRITVFSSVNTAGAGAAEQLVSPSLSTGDVYLVRVSGTPASTFDLTVHIEEMLSEEEPNNSIGAATPITLKPVGQTIVSAAFSSGGDVDFYGFDLSQPTNVIIETLPGPANEQYDTIIELQDSSGTLLESNDDDGAGNFSRIPVSSQPSKLLAAGSYRVKVKLYGTSPSNPPGSGAYLLGITVVP